MKAINLYNILNRYSKDELKNLEIIIELRRGIHNQLGISEYVTQIEEYPSQIRIINKI